MSLQRRLAASAKIALTKRDNRCIHGGLLQLLQVDVVVFLDDLHLAIAEFF